MQKTEATGSSPGQRGEKATPGKNNATEAFAKLEKGVHAALETYSNVHRGSGHNSMVSTHLYEQAREIVLQYLGLDNGRYVVIFCTPDRAVIFKAQLKPGSYKCVSSQDIGLPLGIRALAVERKALPRGTPFQTGGGTTRLISPDWVIWAKAPDKFEAGTPAIVNVIAFAIALRLIMKSGKDVFQDATHEKLTAADILYHDELEEYSGRKLLDELRQTRIGSRILVPTMEGVRPYTNLDNAASTPTFMPVWNAVFSTWLQPRQIQQEIVNEVRTICSGVLGAPLDAYDVIFTSNTTEAVSLAARSLGSEYEQGTEPVVLNTLLEHTSNELPWRMTPHITMIRLKVDPEGFLDLNELDTLLSEYNQKCQHGQKRIRLMAMCGASNVLGVFNDLEEISRIVHRYGVRLLVDAAQLIAHRKIGMDQCGIDYLAFSAHKVYAPFGCGVLVARKGLLNFSSAELEMIQSSGEENPGGIAGLGKALLLLQRIGLDLIREEEQSLTGQMLNSMSHIEGIRIYGVKDPESPRFSSKGGVIVFELKGMFPNVVAKKLAEQGGIGVRYGCHCAHLLIKHLVGVPPFFERLQGLILILLPRIRLPGLVRVSLGIGNNEEDIAVLTSVLGKIIRQHQARDHRNSIARQNGSRIVQQKEVQQQIKDFVRTAAERVYP